MLCFLNKKAVHEKKKKREIGGNKPDKAHNTENLSNALWLVGINEIPDHAT